MTMTTTTTTTMTMTTSLALDAADVARVQSLVCAFERIAATRMRDVAVLHPLVRVQSVAFRRLDSNQLLGVLITPWFMNLVLLPRATINSESCVGDKRRLQLREVSIELIVAYEPAVGEYACCSLYSPLDRFVDHAAALATAEEVMAQLAPLCASEGVRGDHGVAVSRRGFLHLRRRPEQAR